MVPSDGGEALGAGTKNGQTMTFCVDRWRRPGNTSVLRMAKVSLAELTN